MLAYVDIIVHKRHLACSVTDLIITDTVSAVAEAAITVVSQSKHVLTPCAGLMHVQATSSRGRRVSPVRAFLLPVTQRANLHVATLSHVHRVSLCMKREKHCCKSSRQSKTECTGELLRHLQFFQISAPAPVFFQR